jgi:hypothetical protein
MAMDDSDNGSRKRRFFCPGGQRGQAAVEYLVVVGALVTALVALPSVFELVRESLQSKYQSYSFAVAISEPPRSAFDREVAADAHKVEEVMRVLHDLEKFLAHPSLPDVHKPDIPATGFIKDLEKLIHN